MTNSKKVASDGPSNSADLAGIRFDRDVAVAMSDGLKLMVNVFRASTDEARPVILSVSPYGKDDLAQTWQRGRLPGSDFGDVSISEYTAFEAPDPAFWVANGYVVIHGNVRGMWNSEGSAAWLSPQDASDYAELIEWAASQPFSSGVVGLCGVSYLAMSQWAVAALQPPHLRAMIPWEGASDQYREFVLQGGIRETKFFPRFLEGRVRANQNPGFPAGPDLAEDSKSHPVDDELWASLRPTLENITVPALVCGSWSDQGMHTRGSFEGFSRIASNSRWLFTHGRRKWEVFYSPEAKQMQLEFFNHFLKGEENGFADTPRVRLEVRRDFDTAAVRFEHEWPLPNAIPTSLYLNAREGSLSWEPVEGESSVDYRAGGEGHADRTSLEFEITFERDTELTGGMNLHLWLAAADATDGDLFVGIRKYDAAGNEVYFSGYQGYHEDMVAKGWLRISHRETDPARSTPLRPWHTHRQIQPLTMGELTSVEVEVLPSSTLFEAGSSLRLVVQGSELIDYPGFGHGETVNHGDHRVATGASHPSRLVVPLVN